MLKDVKIFEKRNPGVSVNVYGLKKGTKTMKNIVKNPKTKNTEYIITPIKVCECELVDHFDLL